jgi:F-box protein 11
MIDLQKDERCTIVGLKMSHSGNSEDLEELEKLIEDKEMALNLFGGVGEGGGIAGQSPDEEFVTKVPVEPTMNCVVLINGGKLFMEDCLISLK